MKQRDGLWVLRLGGGAVLGALSLQAVSQEAVLVSDIGAARVQQAAQGQPPLPVSHWRPRLQDLGLGGVVRLRGTQSEVSVGLGIRRDEQVELARLRLQFTLSPALLADLSHL